ncbi:MAG: branched-chain amino acid aminotransferase [Cytophagaceae bacterium]|jgi:branched-chain amino acid aminotransferase|nr:branched-chain amino acid aminotransferase [Cytophagaceae bacterium]
MSSNTIRIEKTTQSKIGSTDFSNLEFGAVYSDHMFVVDFKNKTWENPKITPFQNLTMSPACSVLHYGQTVFEGMKAFRADNGDILIFRPEAHWKRLNQSCKRLCMPEVPLELFMEGLTELVKLDNQWIPSLEGCSMYIRPFMYASDEFIGVKPSSTYKFIIFTSPVSGYYKGSVKVIVETEFVRAAEGGIGYAKTGGNYAASLLPAKQALEKGYHQLLWTDSKEHSYFEESGTMNLMFVVNDTILTPPLSSSILAGVTRDSILTLANDLGYKIEERRISVAEIVEALENKKLQDAFGTGTAATITHISQIHCNGKDYELPAINTRKISNALNDALMNIKLGKAEDKFGWNFRIKK